jgi:hypothetical protein
MPFPDVSVRIDGARCSAVDALRGGVGTLGSLVVLQEGQVGREQQQISQAALKMKQEQFKKQVKKQQHKLEQQEQQEGIDGKEGGLSNSAGLQESWPMYWGSWPLHFVRVLVLNGMPAGLNTSPPQQGMQTATKLGRRRGKQQVAGSEDAVASAAAPSLAGGGLQSAAGKAGEAGAAGAAGAAGEARSGGRVESTAGVAGKAGVAGVAGHAPDITARPLEDNPPLVVEDSWGLLAAAAAGRGGRGRGGGRGGGVKGPIGVLVRPDGVIAAVGDPGVIRSWLAALVK